jgi:hypothetical protein
MGAEVTCGVLFTYQLGSTNPTTGNSSHPITASDYNPSNINAPDTTNTHGYLSFDGVTLNSNTSGWSNGTWTGKYAVTTTSSASPRADNLDPIGP